MEKDYQLPERMTIPDWCVQDRPREKYVTHGSSALSDAELIAILLRTGTSTENAVDLAKRLLCSCNHQLNQLSNLTFKQLTTIKGIGPAKAVSLMAAFELGKRIRSEKVTECKQIKCSADVVDLMQTRNAYLKHEEFWAILLNTAANIIDICQIGKGGLTSTLVDIRLILQQAILQESTSIIVCHNHPSGSVKPSNSDINLTKQIQQATDLLNIHLVDHIILHKNKYYSFHENQLL